MSTETLTDWLLRQVADEANSTARTYGDLAEALRNQGMSTVADWLTGQAIRVLTEGKAKLGAIQAAWDDQCRIESEWGSGQSMEQMSRKGDNPPVVKWLALPYADRPGYLAEWAPR